MNAELEKLQTVLEELRGIVEQSAPLIEDARLRRGGLLGYEGLRERLAIDGRKPCLRTVKSLVRRHRKIILPVELGHRLVGFRPARVDALLAHLAGDEQIGGPKL